VERIAERFICPAFRFKEGKAESYIEKLLQRMIFSLVIQQYFSFHSV